MKRTLVPSIVVIAAITALAGCGSSAPETASTEYPTEDITLTMWWWGDQEAPGAQAWVDETIGLYQDEHPNVTIEAELQTTDSLVPSFQSAAAAKSGPDIQYFWGGSNALTPAWSDQIVPVSDYIDADELAHYVNAHEETYDDKIWTAPWYVQPSFPLLVRTDVLEANGLTVPTDWDELMTVCDTLSAAGVTPIAGGVKDGWFGGWLYSMLGAQSIDSTDQVLDAVVGETSFEDADQAAWWSKLEESRDRGCWNDDINSLELYQAQQRFVDGTAAMTVTAGTDAPNFAEQAGGDAVVTAIAMPADGDGEYAGKLGSTSQTVGITSWSKYPQVAADFITFMHTDDRLSSWYQTTGSLPADDRFDLDQVESDFTRGLFEQALDGAPYLENFIPPQLDAEAVFTGVQLVLEGSMSADEAAAAMQETAERIRTTDRDLVQNYTKWAD